MTLKFSEKAHRYWLDGKPVPGVTTLIGNGWPKPALVRWAAKSVAEYVADNPDGVEQLRTMGRGPMVDALKGVPWQQRDTAAAKGTEVHAYAEHLVHGEDVDVPDHLVGYVENYAKLLDQTRIEPLMTEVRLANRTWWYAGTSDLIASIAGETVLIDLKTSSGVYGEYALQCAAYARSEFYLGDGGDDEEQPFPEISRIGAIHLQESHARLHWFPVAVDEAFKVFTHVAYLSKQRDLVDDWGMSWK